jgi:hypothetical protein
MRVAVESQLVVVSRAICEACVAEWVGKSGAEVSIGQDEYSKKVNSVKS